MAKKYLRFNLAFALVFIFILVARFKQLSFLNETITPLITIVPLLFLVTTTRLKGRFHRRLFTGLLFALIGDTFLLYKNHNSSFFLYGLVAFTICHLFYIRAFFLDFRSAPELDKKGARIAIIASLVATAGFYFFIRPHLGMLKLPIMLYTLMMALLLMMAYFRNQRVNKLSFRFIITGVLFLIFSDLLVAYTHFIRPSLHSDLVITATYIIAQYLITLGGLERRLLRTETEL